MLRSWSLVWGAVLFAGLGCWPDSSDGPDAGAAADQATLPAGDLSSGGTAGQDLSSIWDLAGCRTDKIMFSQAEGCQNDGSNEFCIPSGDPGVLARVKSIAPRVSCETGGGRARCITGTELLCFIPTRTLECVARHGALTSEAWAQHCELAALPEVKRIVHTIFE